MRLVIMLAAVVVSGCSGAVVAQRPAIERGQATVLTDSQIAAVHDGVRSRLKDPASATFDGIVAAVDSARQITVCGFVNAKNSYGGYTGRRPFNGLMVGHEKSKFMPVSIASTETEVIATTTVCAEAGAKL